MDLQFACPLERAASALSVDILLDLPGQRLYCAAVEKGLWVIAVECADRLSIAQAMSSAQDLNSFREGRASVDLGRQAGRTQMGLEERTVH